MAFTTVQGSGGAPDSFVGTSGVDSIVIVNSSGNYFLGAQPSNDVILLNTTSSPLYDGTVSTVTMRGGQGNDSFTWTSAEPTTYNNAFFNGNGEDDVFSFDDGDSFLATTAQGGQGDDTFNGATADFAASLINGNKGDDTLTFVGAISASSIFGGQGDDTITLGFSGNDITNSVIDGALGDDEITVADAAFTTKSLDNSSFLGGAGDDSIDLSDAGATDDIVFVDGNEGDDEIFGTERGDASLFGGEGSDTISSETVSGPASITFVGGEGADTLSGDTQSVDRFFYTEFGQGSASVAATNGTTVLVGDTITSFSGGDKVGISTSLLSGSSPAAAAVSTDWNLSTTGAGVLTSGATALAGVTTASQIASLINTVGVTGDAGDIAYAVIFDGTAANASLLVQVELGSAASDRALNKDDSIALLGRFDRDLVAGNVEFG
ncbi:hypothetical protein KBY86_13160 [Synechococcus sp. Lug-A]|uniref:calcium-binding protein n=1 Tax=Synechococcus sp. Lug-A TaxID=2823740 RepID=UPI0020CD4560|nr:calcium-binding protein [Synechococcus sp. Lug-A]MCP9847829.1 hypothetical protein [Synechococcus sp. Lug-A]